MSTPTSKTLLEELLHTLPDWDQPELNLEQGKVYFFRDGDQVVRYESGTITRHAIAILICEEQQPSIDYEWLSTLEVKTFPQKEFDDLPLFTPGDIIPPDVLRYRFLSAQTGPLLHERDDEGNWKHYRYDNGEVPF